MKNGYKVIRIEASDTAEWIMKKHYAHRMPSISYAFGLYGDASLIGICTFGSPASAPLRIGVAGQEMAGYVIELNRLCVESGEENITSWFVSRCLKEIGEKIVVSYADTRQGHVGKIYQACNFIFTGTTKARSDISAGNGKHSRHYDRNTNYKENRVLRSSKHRYIYISGNKRFKRKALNALKYSRQDYPKGETTRYDASYSPISQRILF